MTGIVATNCETPKPATNLSSKDKRTNLMEGTLDVFIFFLLDVLTTYLNTMNIAMCTLPASMAPPKILKQVALIRAILRPKRSEM